MKEGGRKGRRGKKERKEEREGEKGRVTNTCYVTYTCKVVGSVQKMLEQYTGTLGIDQVILVTYFSVMVQFLVTKFTVHNKESYMYV